MPRSQVDIFQFLDYRTFLRAFYDAEKAESDGFSYRAFSLRAGLSSPNHLKRIIDGDRSLRGEMIDRYAKALDLGPSQRRYFRALVQFTDAKDSRRREMAYRILRSFQQYQEAHQLDERHAAYHGKWFIPAIRELSSSPAFQADPAWIAAQMRPKITKKQAQHALDVLFDLGLLERAGDGSITRADAVVTTGNQTFGTHITRYHRTMLEQASDSIDTFGPELRDLTSVTACVDADRIHEFKAMIADFRRQCVAAAEQSERPRQVVQINIQLFPLTRAVAYDDGAPTGSTQ